MPVEKQKWWKMVPEVVDDFSESRLKAELAYFPA